MEGRHAPGQTAGQPVAVRFLRLSQPIFSQRRAVLCEENVDLAFDALDSLRGADLTGQEGLAESVATSELLALPASFGSIFLGETLHGLLSLRNECEVSLLSVSVRCELQTSRDEPAPLPLYSYPNLSSETKLSEESLQVLNFAPGHTCQRLLQFDLREVSLHVIACTVTCTFPPASKTREPETRQFRKLFKFQTAAPLAVKTRLTVVEPRQTAVLLEVHVGNQMPAVGVPPLLPSVLHPPTASVLLLEKMDFSLSPDVEELVNLSGESCGDVALCPQEAIQRHYLFRLRDTVLARETVALGQLALHWRARFGEAGQIVTNPLVQTMSARDSAAHLLRIECRPILRAQLEVPFALAIDVISESVLPVHACLQLPARCALLDRSGGLSAPLEESFIYIGSDTADAGEMLAGDRRAVTFTLLPLQAGRFALETWHLTNVLTKQAVMLNQPVHIHVN